MVYNRHIFHTCVDHIWVSIDISKYKSVNVTNILIVVRWWIVPPDVACYGSVVKGKRDFAVVRFQW